MASDSDGYWEWFEEQLKQPDRAKGGEPCVICGEPVPAKAHWKHRDRHVCSSRCNSTLIRRWKRRIQRGEAPAFEPSAAYFEATAHAARREPRVMRTLPDASFPYEYDRFPVVGDVLERHGHHTAYMAIEELPYKGTFVEQVMQDANYPPERTMGAVHLESGGWTTVFMDAQGVPSRLHLGQVIFGDYMVSSHKPIGMTWEDGSPMELYCNFELFRCLDDNGKDYTWEAISFAPVHIEVGLWTPEFAERSQKRERATRARSSYLARLRALGVVDADAKRVDPMGIYRRDNWTCHICGKPIQQGLEWPNPWMATLDHIEPVSRLGPHDAGNLASAHWICNIIKGNS
ncbi:MAG: HNH endonuclease [Promicromonosporaceae bacterium]|nr:HNH endonuclease [Promicromonosporaceae bacterium]